MNKKLLSTLLLILCASVATFADATLNIDFREVVATAKRKVQPSVLYVVCVREDVTRGVMASQQVSGSAFIISEDGEFVTNWHVVDKAKSIRCLLSDGRNFEAELLGSDKSMDLALCKLKLKDGERVPFAKMGTSFGVEEGEFVLALGAPWGLNRSLTFGTISCARRYLDSYSEYVLWIQTDAGIGPGNSGGPLVNTEGEVIGINALGMMTGAASFGFAIPLDEARTILSQLRDNGKVNWSWSGLLLQPLRDFSRDMYFDATNGVIVSGTEPESPAAHAGILPLDRIVSVNGENVNARTAEELPAVRRIFGLLADSEPIYLELERAGKILALTIKPCPKGNVEGAEREYKRFDFSAKEINQFESPELFMRRREGIFVLATKNNGNSENELFAGDIILQVDKTPVRTLDELTEIHLKLIANVDKCHKTLIKVLRGGLPHLVVIDFSKDND